MKIKSIIRPLAFIGLLLGLASFLEAAAQAQTDIKVVRMTGVRFAYPLVENWIEQYSKVNPNVQILIEWRGTTDPGQYDILVEAYEHTEEIKKDREYVYIGRYAILPVANSTSTFANTFVAKGFTTNTIRQVYFHDIYSDKGNEPKITAPYTNYTRLQKAGSPIVFSSYFKYEQKDIKGKGIAGSDDHLLKAVLRDSAGVSYLPTPLIYAKDTGAPVPGISVIPVDLNGNNRIGDDEKFYTNWSTAVSRLSASSKEIHNVPIEYIHFSVDKKNASKEALAFISWVVDRGLGDLTDFGFLPAEPARLQKDRFEEFASKRTSN
jgi:phosphate transport system substrate-binding protein